MEKSNKKILSSTLMGLLVAGGAQLVAEKASALKEGHVKCKGISTKWVNDCGANNHGCGGKAATNFDKNEWLGMSPKACKAVQQAIKNTAVKAYIEKIQTGTATAVKNGKTI